MKRIPWTSDIEGAFLQADDPITLAIREALMALRKQAERHAQATLGSEDFVFKLMGEAAVMLNRRLKEHQEYLHTLTSIQDHLFQIYRQLILAELERRRREPDDAIMSAIGEAVRALREPAERYARATLGSEDAVFRLMAAAAVILSRELKEHPEYFHIPTSIQDHLFKIYIQLILEVRRREGASRKEEARLREDREKIITSLDGLSWPLETTIGGERLNAEDYCGFEENGKRRGRMIGTRMAPEEDEPLYGAVGIYEAVKWREPGQLEHRERISGRDFGHSIALTTGNIILKLKLLLVCFARWAGWLYFVDEHLLDNYIRHHEEQVKLAR